MTKLPFFANPTYLADHVVRLESEHAHNPTAAADSRWRIADHAEIFGDELNREGFLTSEETAAIDAWIGEFKSSPEGQQAIAKIKSARASGYRGGAA